MPKTLFAFTVHGSKKICSLFQSCLDDDVSTFVWPIKWPRDQFTVSLDITCKEAMKWGKSIYMRYFNFLLINTILGCSKSQHMEFGPFEAPLYSDDDEYLDNRLSRGTLLDVD